ncbi:hypothetical protein V2J09_009479 [Rumex salicifolius]
MAEGLVAPIPLANHALAAENKTSNSTEPVKRPAPSTGGVPGYLINSARSASHCFDASKMNMSHIYMNLNEPLSHSSRNKSEAIPEWEVENDYLDWFLRVSHPYIYPYATAHAPPTAHPPTAMDLTRRVTMERARHARCCCGGHDSLSDWSYIEVVLSSVRPLAHCPLGAAPDFTPIYERSESSRTSVADVEANKREAYRAESVVIGAKRVSQQPWIFIRDSLLPAAPRVDLLKSHVKRPSTEPDEGGYSTDDEPM